MRAWWIGRSAPKVRKATPEMIEQQAMEPPLLRVASRFGDGVGGVLPIVHACHLGCFAANGRPAHNSPSDSKGFHLGETTASGLRSGSLP
jgi:hypothetical protein